VILTNLDSTIMAVSIRFILLLNLLIQKTCKILFRMATFAYIRTWEKR
jgi:hypothetical protein